VVFNACGITSTSFASCASSSRVAFSPAFAFGRAMKPAHTTRFCA
jgi:hypothetical protein